MAPTDSTSAVETINPRHIGLRAERLGSDGRMMLQGWRGSSSIPQRARAVRIDQELILVQDLTDTIEKNAVHYPVWLPRIFVVILVLTALAFVMFAIAFIKDNAILGMLSTAMLAICWLGVSLTLRWGEKIKFGSAP